MTDLDTQDKLWGMSELLRNALDMYSEEVKDFEAVMAVKKDCRMTGIGQK